jgi:PleD family two-component response regulator
MITTKSQSSRTSSNRIISRAESPLTSRKSGSTVSSPFGSSQLSARSSFGLSNASKKPLPPLDEEEIHSDARIAPILIVDDEPYVADLLYHWVSNVWDYPAIIARDGESAIMAMREHHPRMVLLDVHLPDLNGIDVLRALKSADEFLPFLMVSA